MESSSDFKEKELFAKKFTQFIIRVRLPSTNYCCQFYGTITPCDMTQCR